MKKKVKNLYHNAILIKPDPIDEEVYYDGGVMITETDTAGVITYANRKFREMTGYSKEELIGTPHSLIRHPDMPDFIFRHMWQSIKEGKYWRGYIKNLRKDGRYYWAIVWVKPKTDANGRIQGYIAGRKIPEREVIKEIENELKLLKNIETKKISLTIPGIEVMQNID